MNLQSMTFSTARGDYGDFINSPETALAQILRDPVALMLRQGKTTMDFLNLAVSMDPSIKVFGSTENDKATGSTCYQVLSGKRIN